MLQGAVHLRLSFKLHVVVSFGLKQLAVQRGPKNPQRYYAEAPTRV